MAYFEWGWRICFAIPGVLAIPPLLISLFAHNTPLYYIEMNKVSKARREFTRTRGDDFDSEFEQMKEESQGVWSLLKHVFSHQCRPYLIISCVREICLHFSGMFAINFFLPAFLMDLDIPTDESYMAPMVIEYVNLATGILGSWFVPRFKRQWPLMVISSFAMFCGLLAIFVLLIHGHYASLYPPRTAAYKFFGFLLLYSIGYGVASSKWSEVDFPRRASLVADPMMMTINLLSTFLISYALLPTICAMKGVLFVFFTVVVVCMLVFIYLLVPESSNSPEEDMIEKVWSKHWFWQSYMAPGES